MRMLFGCFAVAAAAALWPAPASAMRPTPLQAAPPQVETVQFRFPWEQRPRTRKTVKRPRADSARQRRAKPAAPRPEREAKPAPDAARKPAPQAERRGARDALLPALVAPLALAAPRGLTAREAEDWAALAAQATTPGDPPPLSPDGPGPISAATLAALAPLTRAMEAKEPEAQAARAPPEVEDEPETPDMHVPLPPMRPAELGGVEPIEGPIAEGVPLPPSRPGDMAALEPGDIPKPPPGPGKPDIELPVVAHDEDPDCRALASEGFAEAEQIPPIEGPGVCGGGPLVSLTGVKRSDGEVIKIKPAATLRCSMARELTAFLRDDVAPAAKESGAELTRLDIAGSFQCRGRNGAAGGKMSEHGRANAVDLSGFAFNDGRTLGVFSPDLPEKLSTAVKAGACGRFMTVLGPGSDGFHEDHLHLDLQPRRSKAKLCQWSDPEVARTEEKEKDAESGKAAEAAPGKAADDAKSEGKAAEKPDDTRNDPEKTAARRKAEQQKAPLPKREPTP